MLISDYEHECITQHFSQGSQFLLSIFFLSHSPLLTACHHSSLIRTHRCNLTTKFNDPLVLIFLQSRRILSHSRSPSGWAARRRARTRPVRVITRHTLAHTGSDAICTNPRPRRTTGGSVSHSWHGRVYFDQSQISIKRSAATWYLNKYLNISFCTSALVIKIPR